MASDDANEARRDARLGWSGLASSLEGQSKQTPSADPRKLGLASQSLNAALADLVGVGIHFELSRGYVVSGIYASITRMHL